MARIKLLNPQYDNPKYKKYLQFTCPGCSHTHNIQINPRFKDAFEFNGDFEKPTITPHMNTDIKSWDQAGQPVIGQCDFHIINGRIQFLPGSTHGLAGKEMELPEIQEQQ